MKIFSLCYLIFGIKCLINLHSVLRTSTHDVYNMVWWWYSSLKSSKIVMCSFSSLGRIIGPVIYFLYSLFFCFGFRFSLIGISGHDNSRSGLFSGFQNIHGLHYGNACKMNDVINDLSNDIEILVETRGCKCEHHFAEYFAEYISSQKHMRVKRGVTQEASLFCITITITKCEDYKEVI